MTKFNDTCGTETIGFPCNAMQLEYEIAENACE